MGCLSWPMVYPAASPDEWPQAEQHGGEGGQRFPGCPRTYNVRHTFTYLSAYMTNLLSRILFTRRIVQLWYTRKGNAEGMQHNHQPRAGLVPTITSDTFREKLGNTEAHTAE